MPRYDRHSDRSGASLFRPSPSGGSSGSAIFKAAEALRETELEAAQPETAGATGGLESYDLAGMSIDELRELARELDVRNNGQIIERDELLAAIRDRL